MDQSPDLVQDQRQSIDPVAVDKPLKARLPPGEAKSYRPIMPPGYISSKVNAYLPNFIYQSQQTTEPKAAATASSVPDEEHRQLSKKYQELKVLHKELRAAQSGLQDQIKRLSLDHQKAEAHIGSKQKQIDELGVQCHVLQRARQADGQEINKLQQQLLVFKRGACASAKVANQLTDDEIRQKIDRVYYATQDLAVTMGRGSVLDCSKLSQEAQAWLGFHSLHQDHLPKARLPAVLVSLISGILIEIFRPEYYFGWGASLQAKSAQDLTATMKEGTNKNDLQAWLEPTRKLMLQVDEEAVRNADEMLLDAAADTLQCWLSNAIPLDWVIARPRVRKIFATAAELSRALLRSKAVFEVDMEAAVKDGVPAAFDDQTMAAVNTAEEEAALVGRPIEVSIFPRVVKYGDEMGEHMDEMTVICKARVVPQEPRRRK